MAGDFAPCTAPLGQTKWNFLYFPPEIKLFVGEPDFYQKHPGVEGGNLNGIIFFMRTK